MKKTILSALAASILLAPSNVVPAPAQEAGTGANTVLAVSISGFDAIKNDVQMIAQASGTPQLMAPFMMLGPEGPAGLDTTKPWGAVVQTDGGQLRGFAFVPVTDLEQFLGLLKGLSPGAAPTGPDAGGIYEIEALGQDLVLAQKGGWAFLADSRQTLANVPADPVPLLGGLNKSYAVAVRAVVKGIPPAMRDQVLQPLQMGLAMGQQQLPNETPEQFAIRQRTIARSMEEFNKLLNETDSLLIGLGVEPQSKALRLDVEITAIEGTESAAEFALAAEAKSNLSGFYLPEAALTLLVAGTLPESDVAQIQDMIETYGSKALEDLDEQELSEGERKLAKQMLQDLIAVIRKTVESRRVDVGLALLADANSLNLVGGGFVADPATLEKLVKQTVHLAIAEDPGVEQAIKLDAEEYQGVRLHTLSVPADQLPPDAEVPAMILGDALTGAVGFSDQHVYLALGPQSIEKLKQAIDQSTAATGQSVPPNRISLSASAIGRIVEGVGAADASEMGPAIADALKQAGQSDHITIASQPVPNGMRTRLEIETGVLKAIGAVAGAAMGQLSPGPGGFPAPGGFPGQPGRAPGRSPF